MALEVHGVRDDAEALIARDRDKGVRPVLGSRDGIEAGPFTVERGGVLGSLVEPAGIGPTPADDVEHILGIVGGQDRGGDERSAFRFGDRLRERRCPGLREGSGRRRRDKRRAVADVARVWRDVQPIGRVQVREHRRGRAGDLRGGQIDRRPDAISAIGVRVLDPHRRASDRIDQELRGLPSLAGLKRRDRRAERREYAHVVS